MNLDGEEEENTFMDFADNYSDTDGKGDFLEEN